MGDYLTELLEEEGFQVMHHKGEYDVGDRDHAYSKAAPSIQKIINDNPSIQVVIDLHRDGVGQNTRLVTTQNGKKMARIMFFNGLSRTTASGDIPDQKIRIFPIIWRFCFRCRRCGILSGFYKANLSKRVPL